MSLAATSWGFIYRCSLSEALCAVQRAGYQSVELGASPPHLDLSEVTPGDRAQLKRELHRAGLACVAVNPIDMNLISANADLAAVAFRQYRAALEIAADVGAGHVVMNPGRRHVFIPMPEAQAIRSLVEQLERLLPFAGHLGVTLALEPVPFGFMETAGDVAAVLSEHALGEVGITLDCANVYYAGRDPAEEVRAAADRISLVHISDTWRHRFAHTQVGCGEIDFEAFSAALIGEGYRGASVYELVDGADPGPRLVDDWPRLLTCGWRA